MIFVLALFNLILAEDPTLIVFYDSSTRNGKLVNLVTNRATGRLESMLFLPFLPRFVDFIELNHSFSLSLYIFCLDQAVVESATSGQGRDGDAIRFSTSVRCYCDASSVFLF